MARSLEIDFQFRRSGAALSRAILFGAAMTVGIGPMNLPQGG
jgi:hypothetical protein